MAFVVKVLSVLVCAVLLANGAAPPLKCPVHERANECGATCEVTCNNFRQQPHFCQPTCEEPACVCIDGFVRDERTNACVRPAQCPRGPPPPPPPKCLSNEHLNECGNRCELTCENHSQQPLPCQMVCDAPACVCIDEFVRGADGICVRPEECAAPPRHTRQDEPEYLRIPNFQQCAGSRPDFTQQWCLPTHKPPGCDDITWFRLRHPEPKLPPCSSHDKQ